MATTYAPKKMNLTELSMDQLIDMLINCAWLEGNVSERAMKDEVIQPRPATFKSIQNDIVEELNKRIISMTPPY